MLTIGNITVPVPCILAPMAGITDLPFRLITRSFGAPFAFTEMIDAKSLFYRDKRTRRMLASCANDQPLGIQLLGNDEEFLVRAVDTLYENYCFQLLDFNAACPAPKVVRNGKGSALLKEPAKLEKLLAAVVRRSPVPVTVKIRTGWDTDSVNAREIALRAQDAGVCAVFIHGRTRVQGYSGSVDYATIKNVKDALRVPVIASGDNLSVRSIMKMLAETGCDGVAIARGSLGNPWIFRDIYQHFLDGSPGVAPTVHERMEVILRHLEMVTDYYGELRGVGVFHKFFIWYTRSLPNVKPLRDSAFRTDTLPELLAIIDKLRKLG